MFYILHDGKYLASKGMLVENKRGAYPYRTYQEARLYREQASKVYGFKDLRIVTR